ncbi:MAG: glycosyltransferase family 117 protein [Myxococcota bacterium]
MSRDLPLARGLLFVGAWLVYVATATPGAFWLDSTELAGAAATLGVPHPPGHPLYVILGHAASLVPVGSLGFRIALLSGAFAAWAVCLVLDLVDALLGAVVETEVPPIWPGFLVASTFGASQAVWLQAVRAEVYTLHLALALYVTLLAVRWALRPAPRPSGPPVVAAFVVGLAAGNHHYLLAFHLPALVVLLLVDGPARRGLPRRLPAMLGAGVSGLLLYALLPLRAATDPLIDYGDPRTLGRLLDVVTARVFQRSVAGADASLPDNLVAAGAMYFDALGPILLVVGLVGLVLLARRRGALALALGLGIAGNLATKVLMDLDPTNPDAAGYFQTGMALVAVAAGVALGLAAVHRERVARLAAGLVGGGALLLLLIAGPSQLPRTDLSTYRSPQAVDALLTSEVAPGGLVLTSFFGLHFDRLYQAAAEGYRPDVVAVHQGFEAHVDEGRPLEAVLSRRDPGAAALAAARRRDGRFPTAEVLRHAEERPVYVEPTLGLPVPPERLEYAAGLFRVLPEGVTPRPRVAAQVRDQRALWDAVGSELSGHREARTTASLLWLQVTVVRLQQGHGEAAHHALDFVERMAPRSRWADRLEPVVKALRSAEQRGDAAELEAVRGRIRATDFGALFR